jgi:hypothetical protein
MSDPELTPRQKEQRKRMLLAAVVLAIGIAARAS